jgi:hypothetical protein
LKREDHSRGFVFRQRSQALQEHDPANFLLHIAPAGADGLGDPGAFVGDDATHFLKPGAGRRDDADAFPG